MAVKTFCDRCDALISDPEGGRNIVYSVIKWRGERNADRILVLCPDCAARFVPGLEAIYNQKRGA